MKNKIHALTITLGLTLGALLATADVQAVPFTFEDPDHGTCDIIGQNTYHYIYECENGAILYIRKNNGGNGGGNGGGGNDTCIICQP